ncbi:hypothetical protein [Clostridium sp. LP20]|uniref:hypothetical protein n=1 Tax=Clostridium sp. LP20 TaxID=3418665 RepID=UPI003EE68129
MNIKDFFDIYDFQDCNIKSIINKEKDLLMGIEICNWRQPGYIKSEPEIGYKTIVFKNVKKVHKELDNNEFNDGIREAYLFKLSRDEYRVRLVMVNRGVKTIEFVTNDVEMI